MSAPLRRHTVLFLVSDTGAGHRSAANAVLAAMQRLDRRPDQGPQHDGAAAPHPSWRALIVDGVKECGRFPFRNGVFLYGPATKHSPHLFGRFFHLTNTPQRVAAARRICQPFLRQGLRALIERVRPAVIVSAHPFFNQVVPPLLAELGVRVPFVSVVTDLFTLHHAWVAPGVDTWVVPTEVAQRFLLAGGIPAERVALLGLPIAPAFADAPRLTREERRAALGLDPTQPVILLVGGGEGVGGLGPVAHALAREELDAQLVIVTGRNQALRAELEQVCAAFRMPARVLGFVTNMPELMHAADVLVSKAGSLTVAEALACELPIVLMGAVPGQEEGNVTFVRDEELGVYAPTPAQVVAHLRALLGSGATGAARLARMRANARRLQQPRAAFDVARLVYALVPAATVPSVWDVHTTRVPVVKAYSPLARLASVQRRVVRPVARLRQAPALARLVLRRSSRGRSSRKYAPPPAQGAASRLTLHREHPRAHGSPHGSHRVSAARHMRQMRQTARQPRTGARGARVRLGASLARLVGARRAQRTRRTATGAVRQNTESKVG